MAAPRHRDDVATRRWMYVWIAVGVAIVLVVAGFLVAISNSLYDIADNLDEAQGEVRGTRQDVRPLPEYVAEINTALERVERAVEPLPGQARRIVTNLGSVRSSLGGVEGALNATAGLLVTTSSLLVDTARSLAGVEGTLVGVAASLGRTVSLAGAIETELELSQRVRASGTGGIWRHVRFLNGGRFVEHPEDFDRREHNHRLGRNRRGLRTVETDADGIGRGLRHANRHLESICRDLPPLSPEPVLPDGGTSPDRPDC